MRSEQIMLSISLRPAKNTSHQNSSHFRRSQGNTHTKRNSRVTIDDPKMDFSVQMTIPVVQKNTQTI